MAERRTNRARPPRLNIPARLEHLMPKIHWALIVLRQTIDFEWVVVGDDEERIRPFIDRFEDETRQEIETMAVTMSPPRNSLSAIVSTALQLYSESPSAGEPDRGLKAANVVGSEGQQDG